MPHNRGARQPTGIQRVKGAEFESEISRGYVAVKTRFIDGFRVA